MALRRASRWKSSAAPLVLCALASLYLTPAAQAGGGPSGGSVVAGSATISTPTSSSTVINQATQRAVINWNSFSVPTNSSVDFVQPNAAAITLNRVTGTGSSSIYGNLTANGQVWLINGNGILFGKGSQIDVGAIIATTSDISNNAFMSGNYNFGSPSANPNAGVVNQGTVTTASGGSAIFAGAYVSNSGLVRANAGTIVLAGASTFTVDFNGDNLLRFAVTAPVAATPKDPATGAPQPALVSNTGTLSAQGGQVTMTARAASAVVDNVVNNAGNVDASSVSVQGGEVVLDAGTGDVTDSGTVNTSGTTGGSVTVSGNQVALAGAAINASGTNGGGTISVGSATSASVKVDSGSSLNASATQTGNGGTVTVNSQNTSFSGTATARGGAKSGNGGSVETSGALLSINGAKIDTSAPQGAMGTWTLDPENVTISNAPTANEEEASGTFTPIGDNSFVAVGDIESGLLTNNVTITTGNTGSQQGNINIIAPITWSSTATLTMSAQHDINFNANVTVAGAGSIVANLANAFFTNGAHVTYTDIQGGVVQGGLTVNNKVYVLVATMAQLQAINSDVGNNYALVADLDATNVPFTPLGSFANPFTGNFLGLGNTISNLFINTPNENDVGLFGVIGQDALVRDLTLVNANVTGGNFVGILAGENDGTVIEDTSSGKVTGVDANDDGSGGNNVGGLVGLDTAEIDLASSSATVTGLANVGGLVGLARDNTAGTLPVVANSYATGTVKGTDDAGEAALSEFSDGIGGLIGAMETGSAGTSLAPAALNDYATGSVTGDNDVGGLVGTFDSGRIEESYTTNSVTASVDANDPGGLSTGFAAGGLAGFAGGAISDSYTTGSVSGATAVGGIAGEMSYNTDDETSSSVTNVWTSAHVSGSSFAGAIAGLIDTGADDADLPSPSISGAVFDNQTTGGVPGVGGGDTSSVSVTGLTTAQMMTASNYTFSDSFGTLGSGTWVIVDTDGSLDNANGATGGTFPMLLSEYTTDIVNAHQLQLMELNPNAYFVLAGNVDAAGTAGGDVWSSSGFIPVGGNAAAGFAGTLNGNNLTIDGLFIDDTAVTPIANYWNQSVGLFGAVTTGGNVINVGLTNVNITGGDLTITGALVGGLSGTVTGSYSTGTVTGGNGSNSSSVLFADVGGLVGASFDGAEIDNSYSSATVTGGGSSQAGGLLGAAYFSGTIENSYATGNVTAGGNILGTAGQGGSAGGLIGLVYDSTENESTTVENDYATGTTQAGDNSAVGGLIAAVGGGALIESDYATGSGSVGSVADGSASVAGGLVGWTFGLVGAGATVTQSFATGNMTGGAQDALGGLVGLVKVGTIDQDYAMGSVTTSASGVFAGGLVGYNQGTITNSFAMGSVGIEDATSNVGGLVGYNDTSGTINSTYATGVVSTLTGSSVGGIVGFNANNAAAIGSSYYDTGTTGALAAIGGGTASSGATGESTATLQAALPSGFSPSDWGIVAGKSYAYFTWQFSEAPQVVSGIAYSDSGNTAAGPGTAVSVLVNGNAPLTLNLTNTTTTGANGYYYFLVAPGSIPNSNGQVITFTNNSVSFADNANGSVTGLDLWDSTMRVRTSSASYSAVGNDIDTATGSNPVKDETGSLANLFVDETGSGFTFDQTFTRTGSVTVQSAGSVTIGAGVVITAQGSGDAVVLDATTNFINDSGSGALNLTGDGRWLIYSSAPGGDTFGGLNSNNTAVWDTTYPASIDAAGNRYVFAFQPTVTITTGNLNKTEGTDDTDAVAADYTITGLQAGVANAFLGDDAGSVVSGTPNVTSSGSGADATADNSPYSIDIATGSLEVGDGYALSLVGSGLLTVTGTNPPPPPPPPNPIPTNPVLTTFIAQPPTQSPPSSPPPSEPQDNSGTPPPTVGTASDSGALTPPPDNSASFGAGPIASMTAEGGDNSDSGDEPESDGDANEISQSLDWHPLGGHGKGTIIPGLLSQEQLKGVTVKSNGDVPTPDQLFSSWGNEALWQ